jgi:hypothetical protein
VQLQLPGASTQGDAFFVGLVGNFSGSFVCSDDQSNVYGGLNVVPGSGSASIFSVMGVSAYNIKASILPTVTCILSASPSTAPMMVFAQYTGVSLTDSSSMISTTDQYAMGVSCWAVL